MKSNILSIGTRMPTGNQRLWRGIALTGMLPVALGLLSNPEPASPTASCRPGFIPAGLRLCIGQTVQAPPTLRYGDEDLPRSACIRSLLRGFILPLP